MPDSHLFFYQFLIGLLVVALCFWFYNGVIVLAQNIRRKRRSVCSGFSLTEVVVILALVGTIAAISIPIIQTSEHAAEEQRAAFCVRQIVQAEIMYHAVANRYADYTQLTAEMLPQLPQLTLVIQQDYVVSIQATADTYAVQAVPIDPVKTPRSFYADQGMTVRFADNAPADQTSPPYRF